MHDGIARNRASVFRCHDFKDIAKRRQKRIKKRATVKSLIFMQNAELCDGGERGICKECNTRRNSEETSVRISVSRFQRYSKAKAKKNKKTSDSQVAHFYAKRRALRWRRKRDLNPRYGIPYYSLSRGAPSTSWVFLHRSKLCMRLLQRLYYHKLSALSKLLSKFVAS